MSDLRDHLLDLLTDAAHEPRCRSKLTCFCLVGQLRWLLDLPDPYRKAPAELEPTFRRPQ